MFQTRENTVHGNLSAQVAASLTRKQTFFLAAFASGLFSRMGMVLSGYTSDDYVYALATPDSSWHSIHQGRFLGPLVSHAVDFLGFSQVSLQLPLFVVSLFVLSGLVAKVVDLTLSPQASRWLGVAAAAIAASYPYLTSYYLFRMVLLDQILVYAIVWFALHVITSRLATGWRMLLGSVVVGLGSGDNQLVFMLFGVCAAAWFARLITTTAAPTFDSAGASTPSASWRQRIVAPVTLVGGLVIYAVTIKLVQANLAIPAEGSYAVDLGKGLLNIVTTDLQLVWYVLAQGESIIPTYMKVGLLVILAALVVQASRVSASHVLVCLVYLLLGLALSVAPMAVAHGGHVARIFMCAGFSISLFIALTGSVIQRPKLPAMALLVLAFLYGCSGAAMFYQQHVLSQWDQAQAWSIYVDAARQFDVKPSTQLHLINGSKTRSEGLSTYADDDYGVNESVFRSDWSYAYPALFKVATGRQLKVSAGAADKCLGKPVWPRSGSIFSEGTEDIYVCL
jgi:hypothetical protein